MVNQYVDVQADHAQVARQVARDSVTLLKNKREPAAARPGPPAPERLRHRRRHQRRRRQRLHRPQLQHRLPRHGLGLPARPTTRPSTRPIAALQAGAANVTFYNTDSFPAVPPPGPDDVAVVFITSDSGENQYTVEGNHGDRDASGLSAWHGGDALVQKAAATYSSVVVVAHTVGPLVVEPWVDLPRVKAVLVAHPPPARRAASL